MTGICVKFQEMRVYLGRICALMRMNLPGHRWMCVAVSVLLPSCFCSQEVILPPGKDFPFHSITYLGAEQGLSHPTVSWITQDSLGFMWFITQNGLNRYDGYEFRSWTYDGNDPYSLPVGDYYAMAVDPVGHIWMPHLNEGIYAFDPQCEEFSKHLTPFDEERNGENMALVTESNGNIWIGTAWGLKKYNATTLQVEHYLYKEGDTTTLSSNDIYGLVLDEDHRSSNGINLWIVNTDLGIDGFNTHTGKVIRQYRFPYPTSDYVWSPNGIMNILGKRNESIWIGSNDNAIFGFDTKKELYSRIPLEQRCRATSHIIGLYSVMEDRHRNLWTVNDNNEIVFYETKTGQCFYYPLPSYISLVQSDCVLYEDNNQRVWIGTRRGLVTIDTKNNDFRVSKMDISGPSSVNDINGILPAPDNKIIVSTGIISEYDKGTNAFRPLEQPNEWAGENALRYMHQTPDGMIWISGYRRIISFDPVQQITRDYPLHDSTGYEYEGFRGIIKDQSGRLWTYGFVGILRFDPVTLEARDYTHQIGPSIAKNIINAFRDSRGYIYFSWRHGQGMILYDPSTGLSKVFSHDPFDSSSISIDMPTVYLEDQYGHVWVGTEGGGINVFDPATERFKAFTTQDGLAHNYIQSFVADTSLKIWAGTLKGLSAFVPPEDPFSADCEIAFQNYTVSDGLPSNFCMSFSAYCDRDGTLFFGTGGGNLVHFHPSDLAKATVIPPVFITGLHIHNKPVNLHDSKSPLSQPIEYTDHIVLNHTQNILSFTFTALNYLHSEKNQFAYQLVGHDHNWIFTDATNRRATYTNLDPGEYIFRVKGSNNDGVWNEQPRELTIHIIPAFWQTWWFKVLMGLVVAAAIYALYRYRLQQVLKVQAMRNRIAHDLHDSIGSTLNSISIYSEVAQHKTEGKIPELDLIGESSRRVIDAMSDIVWTINPDNDSFSKIIFRMHSQTHYLMKAKGIDYSFKVDEGFDELSIPMQTRQNFYLIYKEAINNLLKYSQATAVDIRMSHTGNLVKLHIYDNGVGFAVDHVHTGNGMQSMKQRAKAIKGELSISSTPGEGTSVLLTMPA